jgi:hypothetical protein
MYYLLIYCELDFSPPVALASWDYMNPTVCNQYRVQDLDAAWADTAIHYTLDMMYKSLRLHQVLV